MDPASCSLDVMGNAPFYSCIPSSHIVLPECGRHFPFFAFLANSNTAFIAKDNNVFLRISGHILGLLPRTQNLLQLVEAFATGDRCSRDTIDMTYHAFFNLVLLRDYIFIISRFYIFLQLSMHCRNESYYEGNYSYSTSLYKL